MMDANYIAEQCTAIHADNRAKGFWERPRSAKINNGLRLSEIVEAFEGIRKGKRSQPNLVISAQKTLSLALEQQRAGISPVGTTDWVNLYSLAYAENIKDTVEAEVAGTCIRCFDLLGGRLQEGNGTIMDGYRANEPLTLPIISQLAAGIIAESLQGAERYQFTTQEAEAEQLAECLVDFMPGALGLMQAGAELDKLGLVARVTEVAAAIDTLKNMSLLSVWFGIDLLTHIELEVAYNRTRPQKHGNNSF